MYGITLDLNMQELNMFYAYSEQEAHAEITNILQNFAFKSLGKAYICESNEMSHLFSAMEALKKLPWFPASVQKVQVFHITEWSDVTSFVRA